MIVPPSMVESIHHNGDNVRLVPSHPLLSHPDGVVPALEVEVGVLLSSSVDMLRLISNDISPESEREETFTHISGSPKQGGGGLCTNAFKTCVIVLFHV